MVSAAKTTLNPCVTVECAVVGMLENNVYVLSSRTNPDDCFIVDPSSHEDRLLELLGGRTPEAILCTHYHFDHVGAANTLREATGAKVYAHVADASHITGEVELPAGHRKVTPCPVDVMLTGGEELQLAGVTWQVLHTPGHSPGSMCLFAQAPGYTPVLIAGDTLFAGSYGRVDFADGSPQDMLRSLTILRDLPEDTLVLPGHGNYTTIAEAEVQVFSRLLGRR